MVLTNGVTIQAGSTTWISDINYRFSRSGSERNHMKMADATEYMTPNLVEV